MRVREMFPERRVFTPDGGSLNWAAFDASETRVYDDVQTLDEVDAGIDLRSLMVLPTGDYGTVAIGETEPEAFDDTDEFLARILATAAETAFQSTARTRRLHERSAELERQNDRLEEFASVVSHDLRNPLNVAQGRVDLARHECDSDHLEAAARAHDRMEALISDLLALARQGESVNEPDAVRLAAVVNNCWGNVETADADLSVETDLRVRADESRLRQLFENLIRNAIEHGGDEAAVRVGETADADGFFAPTTVPESRPTTATASSSAGTRRRSRGPGSACGSSVGWPRRTDGTCGSRRPERAARGSR